ncbi:hypothetical protein RHOSPDRAFT_34086 [Rhodotorula sp. JG-1b]|nr:hypothetical protein RHOSPDRAFT_34086 [Rhodotorula sp. JG-1b]
MPLAYPPYSSRPAAQSASATIPEGYDADLVNLPERNTAARAARPSIEPPPNGAAGPLLAATLPYPSRAPDGNINDDDGAGCSDDPQRFPSTRRPERLGVRHHHSSPAATPDHHARAKSERKTGPNGGRRTTRRASGRKRHHQQQRRKKLAWWERPRFLVVALVLIVAIGLGVGLGVGLSQANKNKRSGDSGSSTSNGGGINPPSRTGESGGVPVSVSANDVVPMALPTAETLRPAVIAQTMAPAAVPPLADLQRMARRR